MSSDTVLQRLLFRYLKLNESKARSKHEKHESGLPKGEDSFPELQRLLHMIWHIAPTVRERHAPAVEQGESPKKGTRYVVALNKVDHREGTLVRFCVYTAGESHGLAPTDLDASEAKVTYTELTDDSGKVTPPSLEFSVLFFGRVVLIQSRSGGSCGLNVKKFLYVLGKNVLGAKYVQPEFWHVAPTDVVKRIRDAGGVKAITVGVAERHLLSGSSFSLPEIRQIKNDLNATRASVSFYASQGRTLSEEAYLDLIEIEDQEGLGSVSLKLANDEVLSGGQIIMSKPVRVPLLHGVPDCDAVDKELRSYLIELLRPTEDGLEVVNRDGRIGSSLRLISKGVD